MLPSIMGIIALLGIAIGVRRYGAAFAVFFPWTWICFSTYLYFGQMPLHADGRVDIRTDMANMIGFLALTVGYFGVFNRLMGSRSIERHLDWIAPYSLPVNSIMAMRRYMVLAASVLIAACAFYQYVQSIRFGGLEYAMVRFYAMRSVVDINPWTLRLANMALGGSFGILFLLGYGLRLCRDSFRLCVMAISFLMLFVTVFSTGIRGYMLGMSICMISSDALYSLNQRIRFRIAAHTFVIILVTLIAGSFLTVVRGERFYSIQSFYEYTIGGAWETFARDQNVESMTGGINQTVADCIREFGHSRPYWYLYTPYSMAVNIIPRELWPGKPIGFGKLIAEEMYGFAWDNPTSLAAGIAGEGYANGGYLGIVGLGLAVGIFSGAVACYAMSALLSGDVVKIILSRQLQTMTTIFVRGDMLSGLGLTVYPTVAFVLILLLTKLVLGRSTRPNRSAPRILWAKRSRLP